MYCMLSYMITRIFKLLVSQDTQVFQELMQRPANITVVKLTEMGQWQYKYSFKAHQASCIVGSYEVGQEYCISDISIYLW